MESAGEAGLQRARRFVADESRSVQAAHGRLLDPHQRPADLVGPVAAHDLHGIAVQPRRRARGEAVLQQHLGGTEVERHGRGLQGRRAGVTRRVRPPAYDGAACVSPGSRTMWPMAVLLQGT